MASVVVEEALNMKGYLLKVSHINRHSLPWKVKKKSVVRSYHEHSGTFQEYSGLCCIYCFVLGTGGALLDIFSYVCIHVMPVYS